MAARNRDYYWEGGYGKLDKETHPPDRPGFDFSFSTDHNSNDRHKTDSIDNGGANSGDNGTAQGDDTHNRLAILNEERGM